jgi:hypothetical protein
MRPPWTGTGPSLPSRSKPGLQRVFGSAQFRGIGRPGTRTRRRRTHCTASGGRVRLDRHGFGDALLWSRRAGGSWTEGGAGRGSFRFTPQYAGFQRSGITEPLLAPVSTAAPNNGHVHLNADKSWATSVSLIAEPTANSWAGPAFSDMAGNYNGFRHSAKRDCERGPGPIASFSSTKFTVLTVCSACVQPPGASRRKPVALEPVSVNVRI